MEVKSGQTIGGDFLKGIEYWRTLAGQAACPAALVYGGDSSFLRSNVAITSWSDWG